MTHILNSAFYNRDVLLVAPQLLGKRLVRMQDGVRIAGIITETEAYRGEEDLACHAKAGRTPRTEVMYGPPGTAYVYFTYGMHWMLNCVCSREGFPAAVLIRAVQPVEALETIAARRSGVKEALWCNGPAKLTRALGIDKKLNGANLCSEETGLWIEEDRDIPPEHILAAPRIGIQGVPEPWLGKLWNFRVRQV
jgi:DNA-3-methyladenine glycosylase